MGPSLLPTQRDPDFLPPGPLSEGFEDQGPELRRHRASPRLPLSATCHEMASQGGPPEDAQPGLAEPQGAQPEPAPVAPKPPRRRTARCALDQTLLFTKVAAQTKFWPRGAGGAVDEDGPVSYKDVTRVIKTLQDVVTDEVKTRGVVVIPGFLKVHGKKVKALQPKVIKVSDLLLC